MDGTVLITGATGGLGREFARQYAKEGRDLVLVARGSEALGELAADLMEDGAPQPTCIACDLSAPGTCKALHARLHDQGIQVDTLVNNAGFGVCAPFMESDAARQDALIQVNVAALTQLCRLFGADMARRRRGEILNVASVAGFMAGPYLSTYYASKNYVLALSVALHAELFCRGVKVCALCPGPVRTPFWDNADAGQTALAHLSMSPKRVVAEGRWALSVGLAKWVPGLPWKAVTFVPRLLPRTVLAHAASVLQRPRRTRG